MTKQAFLLMAMGAMSFASAQTGTNKVGVIHLQNAIIGTKEGQKAAQDLETKYVAPKRKEMEAKQADIQNLQQKLEKGRNTMSEDARNSLVREIDQKTKAFNRANEDAQAELEQEQGKVLNDLGGKMMAVIDKYAKDNGFSIIFDVSNPNTPVVWLSNTIDITQDIIGLYDKNAPAAAPGAGAARPAQPPPAAAPKPTAPKPAPPKK